MPLTEDEQRYLTRVLDKCDAALIDKPVLASVYTAEWRESFRRSRLAADTMIDVTFPGAYVAPDRERPDDCYFRPGYQNRLEHGAHVLFSKLDKQDRAGIVKRLRDDQCLSASAEEEVLLAHGFATEFGESSIVDPGTGRRAPRPEFVVRVNHFAIAVEAKGLYDSQRVRSLSEDALRSGRFFWIDCHLPGRDEARLGQAVADKIRRPQSKLPMVFVVTQYTAWPDARVASAVMRSIATRPADLEIPDEQHPLAIAYIWERLLQGIWFNEDMIGRLGIGNELRARLRSAIQGAFYGRNVGVLHTEVDSEEQRPHPPTASVANDSS